MSFKTIAGGFNGALWWYGPLSEDREKFEQIHQNYLVALIQTCDTELVLQGVYKPVSCVYILIKVTVKLCLFVCMFTLYISVLIWIVRRGLTLIILLGLPLSFFLLFFTTSKFVASNEKKKHWIVLFIFNFRPLVSQTHSF